MSLIYVLGFVFILNLYKSPNPRIKFPTAFGGVMLPKDIVVSNYSHESEDNRTIADFSKSRFSDGLYKTLEADSLTFSRSKHNARQFWNNIIGNIWDSQSNFDGNIISSGTTKVLESKLNPAMAVKSLGIIIFNASRFQ